EENMGPAKKCADDLVAMKQDKEGRVTIEWTVNDKGETLHPKVTENSWKDPEVEECFLSLLKSLKFPPTPLFSKSTVAYTFKWSSLVDKDQSKSPRLSP
ncbi:MAG: AgmX/PglI C-terminal domain-containing protein, partial [Bdellovibrionales bacterium]|nr:AgmX/PglI C-terminal domain-containing protein [Bdellovibrionales bacterium]